MCMDNTEEIIEHNLENFEKLLSFLYDECKHLSIIVTSRKGMRKVQGQSSGFGTRKPILNYKIQVLD